MKSLKKLTAVVLTALLAAALVGTAPALGASPETLGLAEAVKKAAIESLEVEVARRRADAAEDYFKLFLDYRSSTLGLFSALGGLDEPQIEFLDEQLDQAAYQKEAASLGVAAAKRATSLGAESAYYAAVFAQHGVEVRREEVDLAEALWRNAASAVEAGTRSRTDLLAAEMQRLRAQANLRSAEKEFRKTLVELNRVMGTDLEKIWRLTTGLKTSPLPDIALDAAIEKAQENSIQVRIARELGGRLGRKQEEQVRRDMEAAVRQAWLDMQEAYDRIDVGREAINLAREQLRQADARFEVGLATALEVQADQVQLSAAKFTREKALFDYSLARARFEYLLDGGSPGLLPRIGPGSAPSATTGTMPSQLDAQETGGAAGA